MEEAGQGTDTAQVERRKFIREPEAQTHIYTDRGDVKRSRGGGCDVPGAAQTKFHLGIRVHRHHVVALGRLERACLGVSRSRAARPSNRVV